MNRSSVLVALLVLIVSGAILLHLLSGQREVRTGGGPKEFGPPPRGNRPLELRSSETCQECHPAVYAEWKASHHRVAYTNPEVQRLSREFQDKDCLPCHLPRPVFETGLGVRVLERATRKAEGVDCFTCHRSGEACLGTGELGAAARSAPCNPATYAPVGSMTLCAPCHDQHKVHQDWLQSRFAVKGDAYQDCNDCHMPRVQRERPGGRMRAGRSHAFPAAHDTVMIRKAATFEAAHESGQTIRIVVKNTGTGHCFPADERHRAVDIEISIKDGDRERQPFRVDRFRNPYREEFGIKNPLREPGARSSWQVEVPRSGTAEVRAHRVPAEFNPRRLVYYPESTQIPAGEARSYAVTLPAGVKDMIVRLWYRTNPYQRNVDAVLVAEKRITIR